MSDLPFQKCTLNIKQLFDDETYMEVKREAKAVKIENLHSLLLEREQFEYAIKCNYAVVQRKENYFCYEIMGFFADYNDAVSYANGEVTTNDKGENIQLLRKDGYLYCVRKLSEQDKADYKHYLSCINEEIEKLQKELDNE